MGTANPNAGQYLQCITLLCKIAESIHDVILDVDVAHHCVAEWEGVEVVLCRNGGHLVY